MKPGTQADLRRHLESECNINVTRQAISLLVKDKDYRIHKTPGGKIKIEETAKALIDSGFGKRSEVIRRKNGEKKTKQPQPEEPATSEEIDASPLSLSDERDKIEKHKAFHQAEKERINNEEKLKSLISIIDVGDQSFNLWRQARDAIQSIKDRCAIKIRAAESDHEAEKILHDETHRILTSIVEGYENLDDEAVKKKLLQRLIK